MVRCESCKSLWLSPADLEAEMLKKVRQAGYLDGPLQKDLLALIQNTEFTLLVKMFEQVKEAGTEIQDWLETNRDTMDAERDELVFVTGKLAGFTDVLDWIQQVSEKLREDMEALENE